MSETKNRDTSDRQAQGAPGMEAPLPTDPLERERLVRGLGRTTMVGRQPNGLPITREGLQMQALMSQNARRHESPRAAL